jgi:hypothetical protein
MTDALLLSRIAWLDENLTRVERSLSRLKNWQEEEGRDETLTENLWDQVNMAVLRQFRNEHDDLQKLRDGLNDGSTDTGIAWATYAKLRDETERVFEECLEFIGGVAFRRTGLDEQRLLEIADRLMLASAKQAYGQPWNFLTIPSLDEAVTKSRMRLVRMRFPEWTLWTLPATAYVLGHEVMVEDELADMVHGRMQEWARQDVAERHVHVLTADVFAAYLMGPAYGHASIELRFDPSRAYREDREHPAEASRAHVVLSTLERMEAHESASWKEQVRALNSRWQAALDAAKPVGEPPDAPESLNRLVDGALNHFGRALSTTADFNQGAWAVAETLFARWRDAAKESDRDPLPTEPLVATTNARQVLNAAWLMRLAHPQHIARVEEAAAAMCRGVLAMSRTTRGGRAQVT